MKSLLIAALVLVGSAGSLGAQDTLSAARELYATAAYEDALSTLSRIDVAGSPDLARQVDEYRAFSLFALGRTREAESMAESVIRRNPLAQLDAADTSPRLERLFSDVRTRLLPSLIRDEFRAARVEIERKTFSAAEAPLDHARQMIAEAQRLGVKDDGLSDLTVLVDGFLQLIRSTAEERATPRAEAAAASGATEPAVAAPAAARPPAPAIASPAPFASPARRVYTIADTGVTPPITIDQPVPGMESQLRAIARSLKKTGMLDVVIDESGRVIDATIRQSLIPTYDTTVLRSAARWKYEPARVDGAPVRFLKTIVLIP